jgi:hypothetical protein
MGEWALDCGGGGGGGGTGSQARGDEGARREGSTRYVHTILHTALTAAVIHL